MGHTRRVIPFTRQNASPGELTGRLAPAGVTVPPGFATTAEAYGELLDGHELRTRIQQQLERFHDGAALEDVNVRGAGALLEAVHRCYASLYTDRAIDYRERMGSDHLRVALSVGVQVSRRLLHRQ
ncbi:PEP/pyruvate-binding domain-containing protein [Streptomyces sp. NPDC059650]|uniref:PEP/pyruvate-binding domain-containing protein n=1 Tax=Streptomyces sp. NPDC059650 TaxID=3346896 RepID=UPI003674652F